MDYRCWLVADSFVDDNLHGFEGQSAGVSQHFSENNKGIDLIVGLTCYDHSCAYEPWIRSLSADGTDSRWFARAHGVWVAAWCMASRHSARLGYQVRFLVTSSTSDSATATSWTYWPRGSACDCVYFVSELARSSTTCFSMRALSLV